MQILVDPNLVLQIIADAGSSGETATIACRVWTILQSGNPIRAYLTQRSLNRIYQHYESYTSVVSARKVKDEIEHTFEICPTNYRVIYYADRSNVSNLDYAIDVTCAKLNRFQAILTQQPEKYQGSGLLIVPLQETATQTLLEVFSRRANSPLLLIGTLRDLLLITEIVAEQGQTHTVQEQVVPLNHWLQSTFSQGWLPEAELELSREQTMGFRGSDQSGANQFSYPIRGKLLNFEGLDREIALLLRVQPHSVTHLKAQLRICAKENDITLPADLRIRLLNERGRQHSTHSPHSGDAQIDLTVTGRVGERFKLEFRLNNAYLLEEFVF